MAKRQSGNLHTEQVKQVEDFAWNDGQHQVGAAEYASVVASMLFSLIFLLPSTVIWIYVSVCWFSGGFELAGVVALLLLALPYVVATIVAIRRSCHTSQIAFARFMFIADFSAIPTLLIGVSLLLIAGAAGVL
jgi:hypothetical protein